MRIVYAALGGFTLGVGSFFTFIVPEAAFTVLGGQGLSAFLGVLYPRFYAVMSVLGALLLAAAIVLEGRRRLVVWLDALALAMTLVGWIWLLPAVNRAESTPAFGALHGLSLGLDLLALLIWLGSVVAATLPA